MSSDGMTMLIAEEIRRQIEGIATNSSDDSRERLIELSDQLALIVMKATAGIDVSADRKHIAAQLSNMAEEKRIRAHQVMSLALRQVLHNAMTALLYSV